MDEVQGSKVQGSSIGIKKPGRSSAPLQVINSFLNSYLEIPTLASYSYVFEDDGAKGLAQGLKWAGRPVQPRRVELRERVERLSRTRA